MRCLPRSAAGIADRSTGTRMVAMTIFPFRWRIWIALGELQRGVPRCDVGSADRLEAWNGEQRRRICTMHQDALVPGWEPVGRSCSWPGNCDCGGPGVLEGDVLYGHVLFRFRAGGCLSLCGGS